MNRHKKTVAVAILSGLLTLFVLQANAFQPPPGRFIVLLNPAHALPSKTFRNLERLAVVPYSTLQELQASNQVQAFLPADTKVFLQQAPPTPLRDVDTYTLNIKQGDTLSFVFNPTMSFTLGMIKLEIKNSAGAFLADNFYQGQFVYYQMAAEKDDTWTVSIYMPGTPTGLPVVDFSYQVGHIRCQDPATGFEQEPNDFIPQIIPPNTVIYAALSPASLLPPRPELPDDALSAYQYNLGIMEAYGAQDAVPDIEHCIAILDTGLVEHADLSGLILLNEAEIPGNGLDDDGDGGIDNTYGFNAVISQGHIGNPMDDYGHGQHVAGIIAANKGNRYGIAGVTSNVKIVPVRAFTKSGFAAVEDLLAGIDWIIGMKKRGTNIVLLNNSWGGFGNTLYNILLEAFRQLEKTGIVSVCAAGNSSTNIDDLFNQFSPGGLNLPSVFCVAATDWRGERSSYSNYGKVGVDFGAPGDNILSTTPGNSFISISGTSMAAPAALGAVSLYLKKHPTASLEQLRTALNSSVIKKTSLSNTVSGGHLSVKRLLEQE